MDEIPDSIKIILSKKTNYITCYGTAVVAFIACSCIVLSFFIHLPEQRLITTYDASQFGLSSDQRIKYYDIDGIMIGRELYVIRDNNRIKIGFVSKVDTASNLMSIHIDNTIIHNYTNGHGDMMIYCDIYKHSLGENLYKQFSKILLK